MACYHQPFDFVLMPGLAALRFANGRGWGATGDLVFFLLMSSPACELVVLANWNSVRKDRELFAAIGFLNMLPNLLPNNAPYVRLPKFITNNLPSVDADE